MNLDRLSEKTDAPRQRENNSGSFLLRIWKEESAAEGTTPRVRVFIRNLKTGEEQYLGDLDQLGDMVLRHFQKVETKP
jgi:hypothetical protein